MFTDIAHRKILYCDWVQQTIWTTLYSVISRCGPNSQLQRLAHIGDRDTAYKLIVANWKFIDGRDSRFVPSGLEVACRLNVVLAGLYEIVYCHPNAITLVDISS